MSSPLRCRVLHIAGAASEHASVRELLSAVEGLPFELEWVRSRAQGLVALRTSEFDVILLDYDLGSETALDFLVRIPLEDRTPVILLSSQGVSETELLAMRAGVADFLAKEELTFTLLERTIRFVVEKRRNDDIKAASEANYRLLVESVGAVVWQGDVESFAFSLVSAEAETLLGYCPDAWMKETGFWAEHIHPADRGSVIQYRRQATKKGDPFAQEYRMVAADGRVVWVRDIVRLTEVRGKRRLAGLMVDVTERKQAEKALRDSEEKLRHIAENVREVFWIVSPDLSQVLFLSTQYQKLTGMPVERVYENPSEFLRAVHEQDAPVLMKAMHQLRAGGTQEGVEFRFSHAGGSLRWFAGSGNSVRDSAGTVQSLVGTFEDITERKEADLALERSEQRLQQILSALPVGALLADASGHTIWQNPASEAIWRGSRVMSGHNATREIEGWWADTHKPIAPHEWPLARAVRGENVTGELTDIGLMDGTRRTTRNSAVPLRNESGELTGALLVHEDLTQQLTKEEHLRRVERLASLGTLIGGVAHELNNPLQAIRSFTELMLLDDRTGGDLDALQTIKRESDRAARVVSDLRLIARETQEGGGRREAVDLNDVVRHVLKVRRYSLDIASVVVREDLAEDIPAVLASRSEIEQVVLNLVVNADQAMQGRPSDRRLILRTRRSVDGATIQVVDNGSGIPPQHLERIFDPFFTTKPPGEGTGLGLALVHNIVTEHGGSIHVDSEVGTGSAFRIDLPRAPFITRASPSDASIAVSRRALRILIVDDEEAIRTVLVRFLARSGHDVHAAEDGEEALSMLDTQAYDLIVSDLRMPGLGGDELFQRLRAKGAGMERRLIFLTGDAASAGAARVLTEADVPVLVKPIRLDDLAQAVEQAASGLGSA